MKIFTKRLKQALLLLFCVGGMVGVISAQRTITGVVKDSETGEALIGVTILEKETRSNGTVTNIDGNFTLRVSNTATALLLSYTGYTDLEQPIGSGNNLEIIMKSGKLLDEVIVIGYGTVKREDATGLVQSVNAEKFNRGAITGPQDLLAGKVAGVVITSDGSPGGGAQIRVRGQSSLNASKDPLIVVDGIPLDNGGVNGSRNQLNLINPNDIESFTVLKDASATAIYGNRASAGVILITTKKGKLGRKIQVGYNANVSVGQIAKRIDVLDAAQFRAIVQERYPNPDPTKPLDAQNLLGNSATNWQDEIFQNAIGTDHNVNVSGGIGVVPYRVSLGYTNKNGLLKTDNFKRYTSALNLSPQLLDNRLQLNLHFKGMLSDNHFADRGAIGNALSYDPTKPVRDTSAKYGGYTTWKIANGRPNGLAPTNPVALLELKDDNSTVKQYITNASADYRFKFLPELRVNLNIGYDYSKGSGTVVVPNYAAFAFDLINGGGVNNVYDQTKKNSVLESYLNYKNTFGRHGIEGMAGYSWQHFQVENHSKNSDTAGTPSETTEIVDAKEFYLVSVFGRVNYSFDDRYLLTGTLRRDGTSRFDPDYRFGLFPSAAFAVKVLENDHKYLDNLKVRLSWGITGQQDIGADYYAYLARYQIGLPNAQYQLGDQFYTTIRPNGYVADLQWEETTTYNAGADFSIIKNRLSGSLDIYQRDTKDLLSFVNFPALSNLTNEGFDNIGKMESKGVEIALNFTPVKTKSVIWDVSTNMAYNRSKITKLTLVDDPNFPGLLTGGISGGVGSNIQNNGVGHYPNSFYVKKQKYDEKGNILEGQFEDLNGDGLDNDFYRFKSPAPKFTFGLTSSLSVKKLTLSFAARAHLGQYVYNNVQTDMGYLNRIYGTSGYLSNINQSAVDLNVVSQSALTYSDHFVKNASFVRMDHVTLSYAFDHFIGKYLNIYATIQNPFVITKYDGLDPEIGNGIDNSIYPRPRTYLVGFNVNF